ncbi:integrase core domain-containing protein [Chloroflexota bacterium]
MTETMVLIEEWRSEYNHIQSHNSLGYRTPTPEIIVTIMSQVSSIH